MMSRILIVDNEHDLIWAVQRSLSTEGYELLTAYDGLEALAIVRKENPDLIVLDIVMPRMDGFEVCHALRRDPAHASIPILFLSMRSLVEDRVKGLDEGSDDYLSKPFDLRELKARIRALLRRSQSHGEQKGKTENYLLKVGSITLNLNTRQVYVEERIELLTPMEFDFLFFLMSHPGQVFSSQRLLQQVWGYPPDTADPSLVRWHVKNLRAKIEPDPYHPVFIRNLPRHGYMLERRN